METTYSIKNFAMRIATAVVLLCVISVGNAWGAPTTSSVTISTYASAHSWANSTQYTSVTIDANVTATVSSGTNTGKYYTNDNTWRLYQTESAQLTITTTSGSISSVTITYSIANTGVLKDGDTEVASETACTVNAASKTFSVGNTASATNGQVKISAISVTYDPSVASSYSVTYDANGGSGTMTDSNSPYVDGSKVTVLSNAFTAPDGYVFDHWDTADDDSGTDYDPGDQFTISAATTLYAQWVLAPGVNYVLTDITDLTSEDVFIIVGNNGSDYALPNNGGASTPTVVSVTVTNDVINTSKTTILWNISGNASDGYTFYPNGSTTTWLYCNNSNDGVRIGTDNNNKTFTISEGYLLNGGTSRYVGIYNSADWRCYTTINANITGQTFAFYKQEPELTFFRTKCYREFSPAGASGNWSTGANWTNNRLPNINDLAKINKPVTVDMEVPTAAKAKNVVIYNDGNTHTGQLIIDAGKELVVAETVRKTTDGSNYTATGENDIIFNSTSSAGLGALVMGSHDGTNKATVNFATKSSGNTKTEENANASVSQYVGTPFKDESNILYSWYNSWVYKIDYTSGSPKWVQIHDGDGMLPFMGYCVISADAWDNGSHTYWMQGTLNATTDQTINLVYNGAIVANNENLLANSWMAPIRIAAMQASDFVKTDATIYIFNSGSPEDYDDNGGSYGTSAGQYSTYTLLSAGDNVIPSMQSFSVYTNASGGSSVTLDYSRIVYDPAYDPDVAGTAAIVPNRAPRRERATLAEDSEQMKLFVSAESGYGDMLYMWEHEDFTDGFDNGCDGRKMFGEPVAPQMYAITPDGNMAINCVPDWEGTVVGFRAGSEDNQYTFSFEYEGEGTWYLNDLKTEQSTRILSGNTYAFSTADEDMEARFIISATPLGEVPTGVEMSDIRDQKSDVRKLLIGGTLYIIRNGRMYDATGMMIR